jgi:hypothetical protein
MAAAEAFRVAEEEEAVSRQKREEAVADAKQV